MAAKGKWAQGIQPRNFAWLIKDRLAVCERPGGYGPDHRRVRRQEEIIWIREQGFSRVISLIPSPHNLHNYDELAVSWLHVPFHKGEAAVSMAEVFYPLLKEEISGEGKVLVHMEELGDSIAGLMAGYLVWSSLVPNGPQAISIVEQITQRQMGPRGRSLVTSRASD